MSVGFSKARPPQPIPHPVLWSLRRAGRTAEARVRQVPLGPEILIAVRPRGRDEPELLWSQVFRAQDGGAAALIVVADQTQRDFEARGWGRVADTEMRDEADRMP